MSLSGPILVASCLINNPASSGIGRCQQLFQVVASSIDSPFHAWMQHVVTVLQQGRQHLYVCNDVECSDTICRKASQAQLLTCSAVSQRAAVNHSWN